MSRLFPRVKHGIVECRNPGIAVAYSGTNGRLPVKGHGGAYSRLSRAVTSCLVVVAQLSV